MIDETLGVVLQGQKFKKCFKIGPGDIEKMSFRFRTFEKRRTSLRNTVIKTVNVKKCQPEYLSSKQR